MSDHNRSICDPKRPCHCGGRAYAHGVMARRCYCTSCGETTKQHQTSSEACAAWDRGETMTEAEYLDGVDL